jgi:hypothetical protein
MNIYDLMSEAELSSLTVGLAGRKPKEGETWVFKDYESVKIKINKIENGRVYFSYYDMEKGMPLKKENNETINFIRAIYKPYKKEF